MAMNIEQSVLDRYSSGAQKKEDALCCPIDYDSSLLAILPQEIIDRDYGCGDPSRYVCEGDTVLDLGSGGGKICYMTAQLIGNAGKVIGIDMNDDMLELARKYQSAMAARLGGNRVTFLKGKIQDLKLDIEALQSSIENNPINGLEDYAALQRMETSQKNEKPLIADASIDLVISNCVLNLVADEEKQQLVQEVFRVLKPGGRVAISDIVSDKAIPASMKDDPELWSGCISGAFHEMEMLQEFTAAGFTAVSYDKWDAKPWQTVENIHFRSVTLTAVKPAAASDAVASEELIYRGPFATVMDEAGNQFVRGERFPVTAATHAVLTNPLYGNAFIDMGEASDASAGCCDTESTPRGCC